MYNFITQAWTFADGQTVTDAELRLWARKDRDSGRRVGVLTHEGFYPATVCSGRERLGE